MLLDEVLIILVKSRRPKASGGQQSFSPSINLCRTQVFLAATAALDLWLYFDIEGCCLADNART